MNIKNLLISFISDICYRNVTNKSRPEQNNIILITGKIIEI